MSGVENAGQYVLGHRLRKEVGADVATFVDSPIEATLLVV
jgi:hypothetical protein